MLRTAIVMLLLVPVLAGCGAQAPIFAEALSLADAPVCGLTDRLFEERSAMPDAQFNTQFTRSGPGWTGGDSTYSVQLPDGRTVWIFSDTFLGTVNPDRSRPTSSPLINNSLVVQDGDTLTTLHGGTAEAPASFFPAPESGGWYWAYDGTVEGDTLRIFLLHFKRTGTGAFDFVWAGNALASLSLPDLQLIDIRPMPSEGNVQWGAALLETPEYTYIYGTEDLGFEKHAHLARAPRGGLLGDWEYFGGGVWSADPAASTRLLTGIANEYSVTPVRGGYLMITMNTREFFSREMHAYVSCRPEGPWEFQGVVYETPEVGGNVFTYNAHAHPQFSAEGELLISYNVNSFNFQDLFDNADNYRPRFIRLALPGVAPRP